VTVLAVAAAVRIHKPDVFSGIVHGGFAIGVPMHAATAKLGAAPGAFHFGGASTTSKGEEGIAVLGTQPSVELTSWDPKHIGTLRFNPCKTDNAAYEKNEWSVANVGSSCKVDAAQCAFCAWVLQFDSEYRVNDIVTCLGPTYKQAAEAVVHDPNFKGTVLERLLSAKVRPWSFPKSRTTVFPYKTDTFLYWYQGKKPDGTINWYPNHFNEAVDNFKWMVTAIAQETCNVPDHSTLIVHIRAGDNLNDEFKNIPHIADAITQMQQYLVNRPYITRVELSSVLHFGVPAPDSRFTYNDGVGNAYMMSDDALAKNGLILGHIYEAAKATGRDVWFSSTNDPDDDRCRYAKACHFLSASLSKEEMVTEGPMEQRLSFSELVRDLHVHLGTCDAHDKAEWGVSYTASSAEVGEAERDAVAHDADEEAVAHTKSEPVASANDILSRLVGRNAKIHWRT